jgi:hypothetical protein
MKKYVLLSLPLLTVSVVHGGVGCRDCACNVVSHSFYSVRPLYQTASPERLTLFRDRVHAREEDGWAGALQVTLFGSKTTEPGKLASYFGPSCKPQFTVASANVTGAPIYRDIVAEDFNIFFQSCTEVFESFFCLDPKQTVIGLGVTYKQGFYQRKDGNWFWLELSSPLTHVKNQICLRETVMSDGEKLTLDANGSLTEAFMDSSWLFGRIDPCCQHTETKFADLEIKVGYEWFSSDTSFFESYIGALVPTGNRVTSRLMFEPIVGHNRHPGIICGSTGLFEWWRDDTQECSANFGIDWNTLYLFERVETRSFDLKGKPWSRYMPVYINQAQAQEAAILNVEGRTAEATLLHTPGINVFTQPLCVSPRFAHTFNAAFFFDCKNTQAEIGYNVFMRSAECVRLTCCWEEGPALRSTRGDGYTNRYQTIDAPMNNCTDFELTYTYYEQNIITECDLDVASAAHPAMMSHTIYGSIGHRWDDRKLPCFCGIGFSYEFGEDNSAVDRWVTWAKAGVSF